MMDFSVSSLIRSALTVADLERSTRFYRALGFDSVYFEGPLDAASARSVMGLAADATVQCRILRPEGRPNCGMIGLFAISPVPATALPAYAGPIRVGEACLVLYVDNVPLALAAARDHGAIWAPNPTLFKMPHTQQWEVCLRDPDGFMVNLVERDPALQDATFSVANALS